MTILQRELAQQKEKLASYLDVLSGIGIAFIDSALNIRDCNQGFKKIFHIQKKPIGSPVTDFLILEDNDLKHFENLKLSCSRKSGLNGILYCRPVKTENGYLLFCERQMLTESRVIEQIGVINNELINLQRAAVKKNLLLEKLRRELDERIVELEATINELTRVKAENAKLDAQTRQLQKAESLGRMAGAIAHTFNNQLGVVIGNLEMAIDDMPQASEPVKSLNEAMQAAGKAAEVSSLMLTYLGQATGKHELLDLSDTCRRGLTILRAVMPRKVFLETNLPSPGPAINANENQIQQVLTNLITNAWETAGEEGGAIHLKVKTVFPTEISAVYRFPLDWQPQDLTHACMEITDTGCGIEDKVIENLFDPFFSTKFTGRGMGLAVVLGIVKAHGGGLTVESEPNRGSTFRAFSRFPGNKSFVNQIKWGIDGDILIVRASPIEIDGRSTILLVEDEEMVRNTCVSMLKRLGFSVLEANDGVEAVEVFRQHKDEIRCVLSDLTMPHMNGWETLVALRKLAPNLPVILASGYNEAHVMAGDHAELPHAFLGKPYNLKDLRKAINQVLADTK